MTPSSTRFTRPNACAAASPYFEMICLPSLAAQTDPDFTLVVLIGDAMPIRWRKRLKALRAT